MLTRHKILFALLPLLVGAFVFGIVRLFELRFETGDIYPPYSSLRADPLGAKAFYESLASLRGLTVERHLRPLHRLRDGRDTTFFMFGTTARELGYLREDEFADLERIVHQGGRIVFSFAPVSTKTWPAERKEEDSLQKQDPRSSKSQEPDKRADEKPRQRRPARDDPEPRRRKRVSLKERWGVEFAYQDLPKAENGGYQFVTAQAQEPGVAALIRKYRLHGLVAGLILLAALFVWKNTASFVPAPDAGPRKDHGDLVVGRDSAAGFVNLLRRSIAPADLIAVCFNEWKKSCVHGRADLVAKAGRMAAVVADEEARPNRERNAVRAYLRVGELLSEPATRKPEPGNGKKV